ncbi:MAG TPA: molybdopterin cofactor-binding domain-containing protein [Anaerolineales bacterium]|nr:molybdopterin cofactor-binding domain-containing protein [Anaerolineales bacterium]
MSEGSRPSKRKRLSRRDFLIMLGVGAAGLYVGVKLGTPPLRLRLAEWLEDSGGPPSDIDAPPDAWFQILPDNAVELYLPKSEMGQGVHTGLAQIAAEELEVDWERIKVYHAATDRLADPVATSASTTISGLYTPLLETAAVLRELLRAEAARQMSVQPEALQVQNGIFSLKSDPSQQRTYGSLVQNAAQWELPKDPPPLKSPAQYRYIGRSMPRVDLLDKVTGRAVYGFDVRLPGMLYGAVARPETIEGQLKSARPGQAANQPGVIQVVIQDGFAGVVAESRQQAYEALGSLDLEWEPGKLWQQAEIEAMVTVGQGQGVLIQREGDLEDALSSGTFIEAEYRTPMGYHAYLEPLAAVADVRPGVVEIWASTQAAARLRGKVAEAIDRKEDTVIVHPVYLGGGLGRKIDERAAVEAARLSQAAGRPVQLAMSRPEDFRSGFVRPPTHHHLRAALNQAGNLQALEHRQASGEVAFPFLPRMMGTLMGADFGSWRGALLHYAVPNKQTTVWLASLPIPTGWWRGLGLMANIFAIESFIDELAHTAKADPLEFRLRHLPDNETGQRMRTALLAAAERAEWGKPLPAGQGQGVAMSYDARTVMVEVAQASVVNGKIQVHKVTAVADPGLAVNPDGVKAQTEGAITMGLSASLLEEVVIKDGALQPSNFNQYPLLRNGAAPDIDVLVINSGTTPYGMGEPPIGPIPAATANAVFAATGQRLRRLPLKLS